MASFIAAGSGLQQLAVAESLRRSSLSSATAQRRQQVVLRVASETTEAESDAITAAPEKPYDVSKYTGAKTDTNGISVIDVVEPNVYVADSVASGSNIGVAVAATLAALAGAGAVLFVLGGAEPTAAPKARYTDPSKTYREARFKEVYAFEEDGGEAAPALVAEPTAAVAEPTAAVAEPTAAVAEPTEAVAGEVGESAPVEAPVETTDEASVAEQ